MKMGTLRPQIMAAIVVLGILSCIGIMQGFNEIGTACIGGITGLGFKLLESE
tara:strand:+ start:828 stop:983 length:156 start_codon:yes stop_codon:yes gene_type:complete